jgi:hypothetical protein
VAVKKAEDVNMKKLFSLIVSFGNSRNQGFTSTLNKTPELHEHNLDLPHYRLLSTTLRLNVVNWEKLFRSNWPNNIPLRLEFDSSTVQLNCYDKLTRFTKRWLDMGVLGEKFQQCCKGSRRKSANKLIETLALYSFILTRI